MVLLQLPMPEVAIMYQSNAEDNSMGKKWWIRDGNKKKQGTNMHFSVLSSAPTSFPKAYWASYYSNKSISLQPNVPNVAAPGNLALQA